MPQLKNFVDARIGMVTGDNDRFFRKWYETIFSDIEFYAEPDKDPKKRKWYPLQKGGEFRRWYGDTEYVVNWANDGYEMVVLNLTIITANNNLKEALHGAVFLHMHLLVATLPRDLHSTRLDLCAKY